MSEEAENAVRCFERWSRTHVVFYHNDTRLTAMFPVNRYLHRENVCRSIKACGYERACQNFDSDRLLANAWKFRNGGVKLCPGGVWEWIHSVYWQDDLLGRAPGESETGTQVSGLPQFIPALAAADRLRCGFAPAGRRRKQRG